MRRAVRHGKLLGLERDFLNELVKEVIKIFSEDYPILMENNGLILKETGAEETRFQKSHLNRGLRKFSRLSEEKGKIDGKDAFLLFQSLQLPIEITKELAEEEGIIVDVQGLDEEFMKHQNVSRLGAEKMFKSTSVKLACRRVSVDTEVWMIRRHLGRLVSRPPSR